MKKLLNTLYVLTPESYLFCRNDNVCVQVGGEEKLAVPALTIDSIVCFGKMTVSTPLLQYCGEHGISVTFLSEHGHFMGRFYGPVSGNVLCNFCLTCLKERTCLDLFPFLLPVIWNMNMPLLDFDHGEEKIF